MELAFDDKVAEAKCRGKISALIHLVHRNLGLASAATVADDPEKEGLVVDTSIGSIIVDYDITHVL